MSVHPIYGQKISRTQKLELFGDDHFNDYKGIVQRDGKVAWILVQTGAQQTYPNEVNADCIKYCYSSKDGKGNALMKRAYHLKQTFIVKVVPDKSPDTYFWGMGKVSVEQEDYEWKGRKYRRFVVVKADAEPEPPSQEPNEQAFPPRKRTRFATAYPSNVPPIPNDSASLGDVSPEEVVVEGTDVNGLTEMKSYVKDTEFDSHLERCHAVMMSLLGIKWSRDAPTIPGIELGNGRIVSYTPDFVVDIPNVIYTQTYMIEIKPQYPYDDEIRKAIGACAKMKVMPLFIFYNTKFCTPFAERWKGHGHGDYKHHNGIRGIKFSWDSQLGRVVVEHDAAYTAQTLLDGTTVVGGIDVRHTVGDIRFDNAYLDKAYESVDYFNRNSSVDYWGKK